MKRCSTCGCEKGLEDFSKCSSSPDGRQWRCKACYAAYYREHRQRIKDNVSRWQRENKDARAVITKQYRDTHVAEVRAYNADWQRAHPDNMKAAYRQYRVTHPDYASEQHHRRRLRIGVAFQSISRTEIGERDGWVCGICGGPIDRELVWPDRMSQSLDHILPLSLGGSHTVDNVRITHLDCNVKRGRG